VSAIWLLAAMAAPPFGVEQADVPELGLPSEGRPLALSLEQATAVALRNNGELRVRGLSLAENEARILEARARFDPELFAEAEVFDELASQTARATGERFDVRGQSTQARFGMRGRLVTGTEIEGAVSHDLDDSNRTPPQQRVRLGLSIRQNLLRGFGPRVNGVATRQAEMALQASRWELQGFVESLVLRTEQAYWALTLAERERSIVEAALKVSERELRDVRTAIEIGERARLDDAPVEAELARRRQAFIDVKNRARARALELAALLNLKALERPIVPTSTVPQVPEPSALGDARIASALQLRSELRQARRLAEREVMETIVTRNGLLPRLDFFIELGKTGFDRRVPRAFENLDTSTYDVRAGLSLSRLLSNRQARAAQLRARASADQATVALENLERQVELEVRLAMGEVVRARAQVEAAAQTRAAQARVVEGEKQRVAAGAGTALLLARAQRDLLEARLAEARAAVAQRVALSTLHQAEGSLLTRRKIFVVPQEE